MPSSSLSHKFDDNSSIDRLIEATLILWESHGSGGISARTLARAAQAQVSSIYHHFGSMEQLFQSTHERAKQLAAQWCAGMLENVASNGEMPRAAFPSLLAAIIDEWCEEHRELAFAWRECELMAARDPRYLPTLRQWHRLWADFWETICARCGHQGQGQMTSWLFTGESTLHPMRWRRAVDRASLEETCAGWSAWLCGRAAEDGPWRSFARERAGLEMPELAVPSETMARIARASASVVAEQGMAGLTHRAVAVRAGLTLGVVSYNFRSNADLTRAAFEAIYSQVVQQGDRPVDQAPLSPAEWGAQFSTFPRDDKALLALDELLVAVGRDPDLKPFVPQLRYWRGRTSGAVLQALLGPGQRMSQLDAALFSNLSSGHRKWCLALERDEVSQRGRDFIEQVSNLVADRRPT